MSVPVIAAGIPTVVDAAILLNDKTEKMFFARMESALEGEAFYNMRNSLQEEERYGLITGILSSGNMFVTPKDEDAVIGHLANIIVNTLNSAAIRESLQRVQTGL